MRLAKLKKKALICIITFFLVSTCYAAEGMPQFNVKSFNTQLFWLVISFATLYIITTYVILPRIRENIRLRKNKISNNLERAETIKVEIEKMINQFDFKIEEAKNQAQKIIKESLLRADKEYNNQIKTIKKQIVNKHLEAEKRIDVYKKNVEKDLSKSAISLSATILSKLNYKTSSPKEIEEILIKLSMDENV
ncbi:MAG: hypothetical protein CBC22_06940 [Alphaproteobacteria bacterium TMED62]|nr:MAG: hypothetical protein CBC22_06940 [Alphaproteobacteria bacterium TMED62]|tara:strand:+ start:372 stop:950 length:579 start_codon:yes stop_codon:yes gene_type:complete